VLRETYGFKPVYFVLRNNPGLSGGSVFPDGMSVLPENLSPSPPLEFHALLPMMEVSSWLTGRRGVSLPFTDECTPLCADTEAFSRLYRVAQEHAKARAWNYLEFRGGKALFGASLPSTSFFGHQIDLDAGETALWAGLRGSVRQALRKAALSGLKLEFSQDMEAVRDFFGLLCKTRKRHGMPVQPFRFFESIHRHVLMQNQGWVVLARHGHVPVAGAVFFHLGKAALYKFGASDETFQNLRANNLVMWEAIKWYARRGFRTLDFGRTSQNNEGLRRFKLGWGARERRIDYFRYDRRAAGFVTVRDQSSGWHNRIFRILPTSLSRLVGAAAYRHVA
jgi:hypothetical protein